MGNRKFMEFVEQRCENGEGERKPGLCQCWVRETIQAYFGSRFNGLFGGCARDVGFKFKAAGYAVDGPPEGGDILYKTKVCPPYGHVGIYTERGVAENSSTGLGRLHGAIGYRTMAQWGEPDLIIRLPENGDAAKAAGYTLYLNGQRLLSMPVVNDHALCPLGRWADALGLEPYYDEGTMDVYLDGDPVHTEDGQPSKLIILDDTGYVPIRDLAHSAGLKLTVDNEQHRVDVAKA